MTTTEAVNGHAQNAKHSVVVVDDHPLVRQVVVKLLNRQPDFAVVGEAGSLCEARQVLKRTRPEFIVLDFGLPDGHGLELIKDVRAQSQKPWILVFTVHEEAVYALRALRAGANGFLMKHESVGRIPEAFRLIASGDCAFNPSILAQPPGPASPEAQQGNDTTTFRRLTDRELEVFELIGRGAGTREIAAYLNRSASAIEACRVNIKEKLGLQDTAQLVCRALRWIDCNATSPAQPAVTGQPVPTD